MTAQPEKLLLLTGHLAAPRLRRVMEQCKPPFATEIRDIGVQVAGLMTVDLVRRRLAKDSILASQVMVPGRCRGDLASLSADYGIEFIRGPDDLSDLPRYFSGNHETPIINERDSFSQYKNQCRIFAEITNAPNMTVAEIVQLAQDYRTAGADVIDIGCLPDTPFPHLEATVASLKSIGFLVSVDSANLNELASGAKAGCDYLLSLNESTLELAFNTDAIAVIIPTVDAASGTSNLESLYRAAARLESAGKPFIVDPILNPVPFGLAQSIANFVECRKRLPKARILMGIGNLTELMDADSTGVTATLFGIVAELGISEVLTVQDSPHCRTAIQEAAIARSMAFRSVSEQRLPIGISRGLMALRDRFPFDSTPQDISETAAAIRDQNFRIEIALDGIHIYNRDGHFIGTTCDELFPLILPSLKANSDLGHAFYLGGELARAELAFRLGKRFNQDEGLEFGIAAPKSQENLLAHQAMGSTQKATKSKKSAD